MDLIPAVLYVLLTAINSLAVAEHFDPPTPMSVPLDAPCDPGFGFPAPKPGCPDPDPLLGLVTSYDEGQMVVEPRGGHGHTVVSLAPDTVCTGTILVGYPGPLDDHRVPCEAFGKALRFHGFPIRVALWFEGGRLVQLSELYHP